MDQLLKQDVSLAYLRLPLLAASSVRHRHETERLSVLEHKKPAPVAGRTPAVRHKTEQSGCRTEAVSALLLSRTRAPPHHGQK